MKLTTDFTLLDDANAPGHPAYQAFVRAMEGRAYGVEALNDAWRWFCMGWTARKKLDGMTINETTLYCTRLSRVDDLHLLWIRATARPYGGAVAALDLFDSDRIDCPVIVAKIWDPYPLMLKRVGWGLLKGYLSVYVDPAFRRRGVGAAIVEEFVRLYGNDLMFATDDPSAARMFRKFLTRGRGP